MPCFRVHNHTFSFCHRKLRKAVGVSSKVCVGGVELHHLLIDIDDTDEEKLYETLDYLEKHFRYDDCLQWYPTPNGWHVIVENHRYPIATAASILVGVPNVDYGWVAKGLKRGYWFLEVRGERLLQRLEEKGFQLMQVERDVKPNENE